MNQVFPPSAPLIIRSAQYRDLEAAGGLLQENATNNRIYYVTGSDRQVRQMQRWKGLWGLLGLVCNPWKTIFCAEQVGSEGTQFQGLIQVSPFNHSRTTWRVDQVLVGGDRPTRTEPPADGLPPLEPAVHPHPRTAKPLLSTVGSQLLRYCFEVIWEARTWLLEVDVNDADLLALYRQNGFQPLAQMTYWEIGSEALRELAEREPDLPNLLPVSNADAPLLYQLDTASMPPLVRQVFDRHLSDFKTSLLSSLMNGLKNWFSHTEMVSGYVFEPQRKAAIGYFQIQLYRDGSQPHQAEMTVHPAYTWLYPELMAQMARIAQDFPCQSLQLASSDYQPEREEYFNRIGAVQIAHTLMMSRSVWHKLREAKSVSLEGLQLSDMLQGLQPSRKPVPGRISVLHSSLQQDSIPLSLRRSLRQQFHPPSSGKADPNPTTPPRSTPPDFSDPPQEGPCC
jgi:hypothetical protein